MDQELQLLTRTYERTSQQMTAEVNRLWKLLRVASADLYLALGGEHPEVELKENVLTSQGVLRLLVEKPDIGEWKNLSNVELLAAMRNRNYQGRRKIIQELGKVAQSFESVSPAIALLISSSAQQITELKGKLTDIRKMLDRITQTNLAVQLLKLMPGIGTITSSTIVAEIIDIRRFVREDSLACYSGMGLREHSTGKTTQMIHTEMFNHRLKDAFMTAARNVVRFDPNSHLAGYCRNLVKKGMTPLEAYKRVARGHGDGGDRYVLMTRKARNRATFAQFFRIISRWGPTERMHVVAQRLSTGELRDFLSNFCKKRLQRKCLRIFCS